MEKKETSVGSIRGKLNDLSDAIARLENKPAELSNTFAAVCETGLKSPTCGEAAAAGSNSEIAAVLTALTVRVESVISQLVDLNRSARIE
jgi:hypothetical protein